MVTDPATRGDGCNCIVVKGGARGCVMALLVCLPMSLVLLILLGAGFALLGTEHVVSVIRHLVVELRVGCLGWKCGYGGDGW